MSYKSGTFKREERRKRVSQMILSGMTYKEIAVEVGTSVATICRDVNRILRELEQTTLQDTAEYRKLEMRRLDLMHSVAWRQAAQGEMPAVDRVLKIQDQRAKYMPHLQAPEQIEVTDVSLSDEERVERIAALLERARERRDGHVDQRQGDSGTGAEAEPA